MNKHVTVMLSILAGVLGGTAHAAPGETWEVVTRSEMAGMPYAVPESKMTVCIAKDGQKDPRQMMGQEEGCKMTDVKQSGNKTTWKMNCDNEGRKMSGSGEVTHGKNSYEGTSRMSGMSEEGEKISMTANYRGKRVGAACDTSAPPVVAVQGMENVNEMMGMAKAQMASQMAEQCEVGRYDAKQLMSNRFFGPNAACPGKEKYACKVIGKDAVKKPDVYLALVKHDDTSEVSIAETCGIDMKAATQSICKKVDQGNYEELEDACPAEAAAFADAGRSYTSTARSADKVTDNPVGGAIEGARKLKGLFGF